LKQQKNIFNQKLIYPSNDDPLGFKPSISVAAVGEQIGLGENSAST